PGHGLEAAPAPPRATRPRAPGHRRANRSAAGASAGSIPENEGGKAMMTTTEENVSVDRDRVVDLLGEEHPRALVGGKAAPLARAARAGHPVPSGFVVTVRGQKAGLEAIAREVEARLSRAGCDLFAV